MSTSRPHHQHGSFALITWIARVLCSWSPLRFAVSLRVGGARVDVERACKLVGAAIAEHRRAARMTQETLAERVESSPEWISQVERGVGTPSLALLVRVANALGTSVASLTSDLSRTADPSPEAVRLQAAVGGLDDRALRVLLDAAGALAREYPAVATLPDSTGKPDDKSAE
ncbi:MAG: XRE family transcriptional regulator [Deltaproteobacteria bacterium]|nr:MAG: XRE family transcriptional regulator [Deltaproteobacteria bacterium]